MIILKGNPEFKEIALLFDDGPNPNITPNLLQVLEDKGVHANFFLIGMRAEQAPDITRQIAKAGHEIGNHTYTHKRLPQLLYEKGQQAVLDEVIKSKEAIAKASDVDSGLIKYLRPPYLDWNDELAEIIEPIYGDNIIMSDLAVGDWDWGNDHNWNKSDTVAISRQADRIVREWQQKSTHGTLLGFHDSSEHNLPGNKQYDTWVNRALPTLEAIPQIIDFLLAEGFEIKRLSEMKLVKEIYTDKRK
jgi:peptidoglycan/xylan/chitin deacetylase (PgdA/CDA1 family)